jgi:glycosyltransferase involved in cell wall biosynthesis
MKAQVLAHRKPSPAASDRSNLLFISPVVPSDRGNGLAMRAALFLRALVEDWNVHLLVVPVAGHMVPHNAWPEVVNRCVELIALAPADDPTYRFIQTMRDPGMRLAALKAYRHPSLARFGLPPAVAATAEVIGAHRFEAVHVFRLYMCPLAEPFLGKIRCSLDLDDDDARTLERIAVLSRVYGHVARAELDEADARKFAEFQRRWVARFAPISLAGEGDVQRLGAGLAGPAVTCIPNAVRLPRCLPTPPAEAHFTLLFIGTLGYLPNHDAAMFLVREVLPELRRRTSRPLRLVLVGQNPAAELRAMAGIDGVEVAGYVEDLAPCYASAHVVIAPLRAGGGTRIKILEAFAFRRPVVATPLGVEGIGAADGEHLLLGETPAELAIACLRLLEDRTLADSLAERGHALVTERYQERAVLHRIRALLDRRPT